MPVKDGLRDMIYKRGQTWWLDVAIAGARYRESLGTSDHRAAKEKEKRRIADIQAGKGASTSRSRCNTYCP